VYQHIFRTLDERLNRIIDCKSCGRYHLGHCVRNQLTGSVVVHDPTMDKMGWFALHCYWLDEHGLLAGTANAEIKMCLDEDQAAVVIEMFKAKYG
jgi:hypothetical protein